MQASASSRELNTYAKAANVVEEVLSGIRTVFAFGGEKIEIHRYSELLEPTKKATKQKGISSSIADGITRILFFGCCAISFWFGVRWVLEDRDKVHRAYTPSALIVV